MIIVSVALLFLPLIWEILNEADGEKKNQKVFSVIVRVLLALVAAAVGWILSNKPVPDGFILSLSIHFFFFDYILHWILIASGIVEPRNGENWFDYIGNTAVTDRLKFWREWNPWWRFFIRLGVLVAAITIYII